MWLLLLRKFWPYLAAAALITGAAWYLHHSGYESGYAASEAKWQARWDAADRALTAANEKARQTEADSKALSQSIEARHAETVASLTSRAADAERRITQFVRQLAKNSSSCPVPEAGSATSSPAAASEIERSASEIGSRITEIGRGCAEDALTIRAWQEWYTAQSSIFEW